MKQSFFFILAFTILIFTSCRKENINNIKKEYYIISKEDSINKKNGIPPPPSAPPDLKWYSNTVFIIGTDKVYIYQTEKIERRGKNEIYEYSNPNYIGLKPGNLITIENENLLAFLKDNNEIFELTEKQEGRMTFFYIASVEDTIKNPAFYDLEKMVSNERKTYHMVRKTTEEENFVLDRKREKKPFYPENYKWSTNFITGKYRPFTEEYKLEESHTQKTRKAIEVFRKGGTELVLYL